MHYVQGTQKEKNSIFVAPGVRVCGHKPLQGLFIVILNRYL